MERQHLLPVRERTALHIFHAFHASPDAMAHPLHVAVCMREGFTGACPGHAFPASIMLSTLQHAWVYARCGKSHHASWLNDLALLLRTQITCTYGASLNPQMFVNMNISTSNLAISFVPSYSPPPTASINYSAWHAALPTTAWPVGATSSYVNVTVTNNDTRPGGHLLLLPTLAEHSSWPLQGAFWLLSLAWRLPRSCSATVLVKPLQNRFSNTVCGG